MKRSIVLFLVSFLATAGVGGGIYYAFTNNLIPGAGKIASILNPGTDTDANRRQMTSGNQTPEETPATPEPKDEPQVQESTPETTVPAAPQPPVEPQPPVDPQPPVAPEPVEEPDTPKVEPTPTAPDFTLPNPESARNEEHRVALLALEAIRHGDLKAALEYLIKRRLMTDSAAAVIQTWAANNTPGELIETANSRREDGNKVTRFRVHTTNGTEDLILDVVTDRNGAAIIENASTVPADKTAITVDSDHITATEGFFEAVRNGDMVKACSMITGEEISFATVAGLCMIFEEDNFRMREHSPIRNTFVNDGFAGNLVYLTSSNPEITQEARIAVELARTPEGWRVKAAGLEGLLLSYENSAVAEGGRYFPIVKNPKGGDSIALFFGFNEADLTPRSLRQLQIIAELLKGTERRLNISGHTDDVGTERYNQSLSERRAAAVKEALVGYGASADQITTHGLGMSQPRRLPAATDSEQTIDYIRGENRRAEIYLDFES